MSSKLGPRGFVSMETRLTELTNGTFRDKYVNVDGEELVTSDRIRTEIEIIKYR